MKDIEFYRLICKKATSSNFSNCGNILSQSFHIMNSTRLELKKVLLRILIERILIKKSPNYFLLDENFLFFFPPKNNYNYTFDYRQFLTDHPVYFPLSFGSGFALNPPRPFSIFLTKPASRLAWWRTV